MSKIKNAGLDQYGAVPFEQQQFGTAGVEGVKLSVIVILFCALSAVIVFHHTLSYLCIVSIYVTSPLVAITAQFNQLNDGNSPPK